MNQELINAYRKARAHQRSFWGTGGTGLTVYKSGRTEVTYGGGYDTHALAAYNSARSSIAFRKRLAKDVADHKKRSRAAKAAWKRRKAVAHA